jgi:diaminohydroxyphosphoribosylaminopyrimidine deaminase/5-amino-6-(5-phosphoribosylamino)uracil reductase
MKNFSDADRKWMSHALELARRAEGQTRPNPLVGAVIVGRQGELLGEGWHRRAGEPHAEVEALRAAEAARRDVSGATMYVTLEPCNHHGRTGPCSLAVADAGISRLVVAMRDPNPMAGGGLEYLQLRGVHTEWGCLEEEAWLLNPGFNTLHALGRPLVTLKWAMTMDGCSSMESGSSQWITGEEARAEVHRRRAREDAILVGVETALLDGARLTARVPEPPPGPPLMRIVLDSELRLPPAAPLLAEENAGPAIIVCREGASEERAFELKKAGAELIAIPRADHGLDLQRLLAVLAKRQVQRLYVEGGRKVAGGFLREGLVDRVESWIGARLAGGGNHHLGPLRLAQPLELMVEAPELHHCSVSTYGNDVLIEGWLSRHLFQKGAR